MRAGLEQDAASPGGKLARSTLALLTVAIAALLASVGVASPAHGAPPSARPEPPTSAELRARTPQPDEGASALNHLGTASRLPSGGTQVLPNHRVISLYGAPQMHATILGRLSPSEAGRRVRAETLRYRFQGSKPRVRAFELVATIATADNGRDRLYRFRQSQATIATYLKAARAARARLILDIQPGRSPFTEEVRALERWLRQPDVDVALDPEWNVGRRGIPGRTDGSVDAATVNAVSRQLAGIVRDRRIPQKMLIVHQFRSESVRDESDIVPRRRVATTLSFDGIGSPRAKASGYRALSSSHLFNGFCLFYRLDNPLMSPSSVLRLRPRPDYVMYQ